ncbi:hypothetical protein RJT34_26864 [Clitoria ternatea]|uniref:Uncharacterized protein n=1 Tax=Clitoria ternatea TaxID=43366 RepID=A0AAN9IG11_CLITE
MEYDEAYSEGRAVALWFFWRRDEVPDKDAGGANVDVFEPMKGVDLDHDCRCVRVEKGIVNMKDEFVVPGWVGMAFDVVLGSDPIARQYERCREAGAEIWCGRGAPPAPVLRQI